MKLAEFERRITDAAEDLQKCAQKIKEDNAFEVEGWLIQTYKDLLGCKQFATEWANKQEAEIAKVEMARGYDIVGKL